MYRRRLCQKEITKRSDVNYTDTDGVRISQGTTLRKCTGMCKVGGWAVHDSAKILQYVESSRPKKKHLLALKQTRNVSI